jgi:hypothetical protein
MLHPIRTESYKFQGVPLTETEKKRAKKFGHPISQIRGVFRYQGVKGTKRKMVLIFREQAKTEKDGIIVAGRTVSLTRDDFEIGLDLGKIKGRAKKVRAS